MSKKDEEKKANEELDANVKNVQASSATVQPTADQIKDRSKDRPKTPLDDTVRSVDDEELSACVAQLKATRTQLLAGRPLDSATGLPLAPPIPGTPADAAVGGLVHSPPVTNEMICTLIDALVTLFHYIRGR